MIIKKEKLAIIGAGGHGLVVAEIAELLGYSPFFFDDKFPSLRWHKFWPVLGKVCHLLDKKHIFKKTFVAIGDNSYRLKFFFILKKFQFQIISLIHPSAIISKRAFIEEGSLVSALSIINSSVYVGCCSILNTNSVIEHECYLSKFVHIAPATTLGGSVKVGEGTLVGLGSSVRPNISIGSNSIIGVGSVVVQNVPSRTLVFGNPAKEIRKLSHE